MPFRPFLLFHRTAKSRKNINSFTRREEVFIFFPDSLQFISFKEVEKGQLCSLFWFYSGLLTTTLLFSKELFCIFLLWAMLHALIFQHDSRLLALSSYFHILCITSYPAPRHETYTSYGSNVLVGHNSAFAVSQMLWKHTHTKKQLHQWGPGIPYVGAEFTQVKFCVV